MAYSEKLAQRVRALVKPKHGIVERRMFGGIAFMLKGKMFCGVLNADFMARVGRVAYADALKKRNVRPMDFTGRPLTGYVFVSPEAIRDRRSLGRWFDICLAHAATLPATAQK